MKTAICLCVKNEEKELVYWMAWHKMLGFDAFIVYDDASDDNTISVLESLSDRYDIRIMKNFENKDRSVIRQCRCYNDAITKYRDEFDWIAFFDSDEYMDIHGKTIEEFLVERGNSDCIVINWCCFGSNGHIERPFGPPIFSYTKHGQKESFWNRHTKVIVRPQKIKDPIVQVHNVTIEGETVLNNGGNPNWTNAVGGFVSGNVNWDNARLLHYQSRSIEHYVNKNKYIDDVRKRAGDPLQVITKGSDYDVNNLEMNSEYINKFIHEMYKLSSHQRDYFILKIKNDLPFYIEYLKKRFEEKSVSIFKPDRVLDSHDVNNRWISFHYVPGNILPDKFEGTDKNHIVFTMKNNFGYILGAKDNKLSSSTDENDSILAIYTKGSEYIHFIKKDMGCFYAAGDYVFSKMLTYKVWPNENGTFSISNFKNGRYLGFLPDGNYIFSKLRALSWEEIIFDKLVDETSQIKEISKIISECKSYNYIYNMIDNTHVRELFFNLLKIIPKADFSALNFICGNIINEHLM